GSARMNSLDFTGARDEFEKAVALNPKLPEANASLGLSLLGLSQADAAGEAFRREIAVDPNNFTAVLQSGILAKQNQNYPEARQFLRRALALRPADPGVRYQIATVEISAGAVEEGRRQLEALLADHPGFLEAHVSLSGVYYRLKRKEDGDRERAIVRRLTAEAQAKEPAAQGK
ncbi:MAG TPA: tetratricopeptide repeat protein, partial [Bryobacteraceae bacterium]|nr:tetratricopeptide repeat protein [Bryobacteraceae bacterium]